MAVLVIAIIFIYRAGGTDAGPAPVVIVMGDSLSIGCCAPEEDTWPAIFPTRLGADLAKVAVGEATSESLVNEVLTWASGRTQPQLDEAVSLIGESPDVAAVTLGIGTNDLFQIANLCFDDPPNCETILAEGYDQLRVNLEFILGTLGAALQPGTPLIVMNVYVGGKEQPANSIIASEVAAHGALLADIAVYFDQLPDLLAADDIHKIAAGHRVIADVLTNTMAPDSDGDGLSDLMEAVFGSDPDVEDTDGDGCRDGVEFGPRAVEGGQRDPTVFWDFFDVWTHPLGASEAWVRDAVINLPGDIIGVASRFGPGTAQSKEDALAAALTPPVSDSGYHAAFDRGPVIGANIWTPVSDPGYHAIFDRWPVIGANNWKRAPADGAINVPDDIVGVALQFGHRCLGSSATATPMSVVTAATSETLTVPAALTTYAGAVTRW